MYLSSLSIPEINIVPVRAEICSASPEPKPLPVNTFARAVTTDELERVFDDYLQLEVGDGSASPDTVRSYQTQIKLYLEWCRDNVVPPLEADADDIRLYRQHLIGEGKTPGTIANSLSIVASLYNAALAANLVVSNPATGIKAPQYKSDPAANISFLELEEIELLLEEIDTRLARTKTQKQQLPLLRDRALIGIMTFEGTRTVEMHQLRLQQIVRQGNKVGLKVTAKRASRIVPLTNLLAQQLDEYLTLRIKVLRRKLKDESYVFVSVSNNSKGKQLSRRGIRAIIDLYLVATGLKHKNGRTLSAHSLRHTAGTQALRAGADLRQVQDLLGHADPRTTSIYTHVGDRWANNPASAVEQRLRSD